MGCGGGAAGASLLTPGPFFHWKVPPAANPWPHSRPIMQPRAGMVHLLYQRPGGLRGGAAPPPTDPPLTALTARSHLGKLRHGRGLCRTVITSPLHIKGGLYTTCRVVYLGGRRRGSSQRGVRGGSPSWLHPPLVGGFWLREGGGEHTAGLWEVRGRCRGRGGWGGGVRDAAEGSVKAKGVGEVVGV